MSSSSYTYSLSLVSSKSTWSIKFFNIDWFLVIWSGRNYIKHGTHYCLTSFFSRSGVLKYILCNFLKVAKKPPKIAKNHYCLTSFSRSGVLKYISLKIAQFSWLFPTTIRNSLISPTILALILPSATPFSSKKPTMTYPFPSELRCRFKLVKSTWGFSGRISMVVSSNLSEGCSALPDTNLKPLNSVGSTNLKRIRVGH